MLTDSNCTCWGEDLVICETVESLCDILETGVILYINYIQ